MSDPFEIFEPFEPLEPLAADHAERAEGTEERPPAAPARRWATPPRAAAVPERPARLPRKEPNSAPRTVESPAAAATGVPTDELPEPEGDVLSGLEMVVLPELRAASRRLSSRGHHAEVRAESHEGGTRLLLRFGPDQGPLAFRMSGRREYALLEFRSGVARNDLGHIVASHTAAEAPGAEPVVLGRTPARSVTREWVARQVIEFVARTLEQR